MLVKSVILKKKNKSKTQIYIKLYLSHNKSKYIPTKLFIEPWLFNHVHGRVSNDYVNAGEMNIRLLELEQQTEREYLTKENKTFDNRILLHKYFLNHIKNLSRECSFSHINNLETIANKFERFRPGAFLTDVDYSYIKAYKQYCFELKRPNSINTINKNLEQLNALISEAIRDGKFDANKDPFKNMEFNNVETKKKRLPYKEIKKLEEAEVINYNEQLAKITYLLSFYNGGIRFGDMCRIQWSSVKGGEIKFTPNKTKRSLAEKIIVISPPVEKLLQYIKQEYKTKKYILPILEGKKFETDSELKAITDVVNTTLNNALKKISVREKLSLGKNISLHTARHSFSDYAIDEDVDPYTLMELLGHKKFSTTQRYLQNFNKKKATRAINTMFGEKKTN